jgi:hypothetical protein
MSLTSDQQSLSLAKERSRRERARTTIRRDVGSKSNDLDILKINATRARKGDSRTQSESLSAMLVSNANASSMSLASDIQSTTSSYDARRSRSSKKTSRGSGNSELQNSFTATIIKQETKQEKQQQKQPVRVEQGKTSRSWKKSSSLSNIDISVSDDDADADDIIDRQADGALKRGAAFPGGLWTCQTIRILAAQSFPYHLSEGILPPQNQQRRMVVPLSISTCSAMKNDLLKIAMITNLLQRVLLVRHRNSPHCLLILKVDHGVVPVAQQNQVRKIDLRVHTHTVRVRTPHQSRLTCKGKVKMEATPTSFVRPVPVPHVILAFIVRDRRRINAGNEEERDPSEGPSRST